VLSGDRLIQGENPLLTHHDEDGSIQIPSDFHVPHAHICLAIRNLIIDRISRDVEEESSTVRELSAEIMSKISIVEMPKRDCFKNVAGADAGSQILPLASRRYGIVNALVYSLPVGRRFFHPPECVVLPYTISNELNGGTINIRRESKLFETAYSFVEQNPETELLLIDGPLAFSNLWSTRGRRPDQQRLIDAVNELLRCCSKNDVAVVGIVKRPSARYLIYHLGLQDRTDMPDAYLLHQALRPGERTDFFSARAALRKATRPSPFMDAIGFPIYSFYSRFSREWSIPPIRIDVPSFCLGMIEDIADYCHWSSLWNGIPLPIARADEDVRISKRFMSEVYSEVIGYVGTRSGDVSYLAPYWGEGGWMGA